MSTASSLHAVPNPADKLMHSVMGFMVTASLHAVTTLGIPDLLKQGPVHVSTLAKSTASNEDALYRVMRALASNGIFTESASRTFALTPPAELLVKGAPGSMRDMVLWCADVCHFRVFPELLHAIKTGETVVEKVYGVSCFEFFEQDQAASEVFNNAMSDFSASVVSPILEAYDFSFLHGKTLADIAGGHGVLLCGVLKKYPSLRGILTDLPHVLEGAKPKLAAHGLTERCTLTSADFFREVPSSDAYMLQHVIHDWDDEKAGTILRNIHRASPVGTKVLVLETVVAPGDTPQVVKWLDLEMLLFPGGLERTEKEYSALLAASGFQLQRVLPTKSPLQILEAVSV
jgi:ubiquinone/menaquinone biosynthesis C-methylase UbiE